MKKKILLLICFMISCLSGITSLKAEAAEKYVRNRAVNTVQSVNGVKFVARQYKSGSSYYYKIIMKKGNKSKTIAKKTTSDFVTNGKVLYYVKVGSRISDYQYRNTIYQYNIKTGKHTKIISGTEYTVCGCSGTYLYCGVDNWADGVELYALNLKTKKKKHMVDVVGGVYVYGNRVVTSTNTGDVGNYPIYSFNLNGSGKKKLDNGGVLKVEKGKVYYYRLSQDTMKYKIYTCSLTGKKKKAVTGWVKEIPSKYRPS